MTISGPKPRPSSGLPKLGIVRAPEELVDRPAVAIARVKISQRVERQPERVDLSVREVFGVRAVRPHPVGVARVHGDWAVVASLDFRVVGVAVASVDPAVEAPRKSVGHAVSVAIAEDSVEHLAGVGMAVAIRVPHQVDVGDVMDDRRSGRRQRQQADRDVQAVGERLDLAGSPIGAENPRES